MNTASRQERIVALVLAGLCVLFGVVVLVEWSQLESHLRDRQAETAIPVKSELSFEKLSEVDFELPVIDSYSELVERPLLIEGRRPLEEQPVDDQQQDEFQGVKLTAKLMGIYSSPDGMTALIVDAEGKYVRARKQDSVDGWQVDALFPDRVTFKQGVETQDVKLHKPKPKFSRRAKQAKQAKQARQRKSTPKSMADARAKAKAKARARARARAKTKSDLKSQARSKLDRRKRKEKDEDEEEG